MNEHALRPWAFPAAIPSPSERALAALGPLCLKAFLLAQFLSLTRLYWSQRFGDSVLFYASQAGLLSVAFLFPAVVVYGLGAGSLLGTLTGGARLWIVALLTLAAFLFLYGWLVKGYLVNAVAHDLCPYLVIVAWVVLGSIGGAWQDVNPSMILLFLAALVVNALGMTEATNVVSESYPEDRAIVGVVAYRTQAALAFWPLLLLTTRLRRPRTAFLIFAGYFFVLAQQILFQKRSPVVRVLLFLPVLLVVLPHLRSRGAGPATGIGERRLRTLLAAAFGLALVVSLSAAPWLFRGQLTGLLQRLSGQAYSGGATGMLTWENERFFEVGMFFQTLEPQEFILGRGFGGYFIPSEPKWGEWIDDAGDVARRQLHVGVLMPFFKGGLVLTFVYYSGLAFVLLRGRRFLVEPCAAAAYFVLLVHAVFLLQEGWFFMSASFDLVVVGLCMGHILSVERGREDPDFSPPSLSAGRVHA